jgi:hypothetical protein
MVGSLPWRGGADTSYLEAHINGAGLFECESARECFTLLQRLVQIKEHEVIGVGLQRHRPVRGHRQPVPLLAHLHDSVGHAHLMNFGAPSDIRRHPPSRRRVGLGYHLNFQW